MCRLEDVEAQPLIFPDIVLSDTDVSPFLPILNNFCINFIFLSFFARNLRFCSAIVRLSEFFNYYNSLHRVFISLIIYNFLPHLSICIFPLFFFFNCFFFSFISNSLYVYFLFYLFFIVFSSFIFFSLFYSSFIFLYFFSSSLSHFFISHYAILPFL